MYLDRFLKWLEDWIQISYIEKIEENEYSTVVKFALGFTVNPLIGLKPIQNGMEGHSTQQTLSDIQSAYCYKFCFTKSRNHGAECPDVVVFTCNRIKKKESGAVFQA